jgi:beta-glucanase (GH16 family)
MLRTFQSERNGQLRRSDLNHRWMSRAVYRISGFVSVSTSMTGVLTDQVARSLVQHILGIDQTQACAADPMCISSGTLPLLKNVRTSLVDPATPTSVYTRQSVDGKTQKLVFSDEFNTDGRTFYPGDDPFFTAVDIWYGVTQDLEWYDPDAITTQGGTLNIRFDAFKNHNLNYRSGMLQSWNQLCFKGGYMEASISLPGAGDTSGFWPGFWSMGNLGRAGYAATTDGMWPYSYDNVCDAGITPNQSDTTGLSYLPGMRLPACTCNGEDHPTPGISRSAPEIDAIEATVTYLTSPNSNAIGAASQSLQTAPFDIFWQPNFGKQAPIAQANSN